MRSRLLLVTLTLAVGFLLVTHPVVVEAAAQITGADIKDGTVTTADVRNRTLRRVDHADGVLPQPSVKRVRRIFSNDNSDPVSTTQLAFEGPTVTVNLDGDDLVIGAATLVLHPEGQSVMADLCRQKEDGSTGLLPLSGQFQQSFATTLGGAYQPLPLYGAVTLPAGRWRLGACAGNASGAVTRNGLNGWFQVIDGVAAIPPLF